jgi:ribosomal protein S18 acetylase RimI-like enzyme
MSVTYREYQETDREILFGLTKKLEEYIKSIDPMKRIIALPGFAEASFVETMENVEKYQGKIYFAEDKGITIGYTVAVIWKQSDQNKLEIGEHKLGEIIDLYIEERYRGKGIGTTLIDMCETYVRGEGCDSMWIDVFAPNERAYELYKRKGFIPREIGLLKPLEVTEVLETV